MQHRYSAQLSYKAKKGMFPAMRGKILEGDIEVGTFSRGPVCDGFVPPIVYKFHSTAAHIRFDDFADCLSIEETIEAILPF